MWPYNYRGQDTPDGALQRQLDNGRKKKRTVLQRGGRSDREKRRRAEEG